MNWGLSCLDLNVIVAGILSVCIAIASVLIGERLIRNRDRAREKAEAKRQRRHLAKALHAELSTVLTRYDEAMGPMIEKAAKWDQLGQAIIDSIFFTVFDGNSMNLGLLDDQDITSIVGAYVSAKGHVDTLRTWTFLQQQGQQSAVAIQSVPTLQSHEKDDLVLRTTESLNGYLQLVKRSHSMFRSKTQEALTRLAAYFADELPKK